MNVEVAEQVAGFVRQLPPEPRRRLRQALRDLARERGDIKPLEGSLEGYCRLRVGAYRIVFSYAPHLTTQCVFAERRSLVCELFLNLLESRLPRRQG